MLTTNPVRLFALLATLASVAVAAALIVITDGDILPTMQELRLDGQLGFALCLGWLTVAPVPMVVGSSYVPISVGPWIVIALVQIGTLVALSLYLHATLTLFYWVGAVICGVGCVASVVAAAAGHGPRAGDF